MRKSGRQQGKRNERDGLHWPSRECREGEVEVEGEVAFVRARLPDEARKEPRECGR